MPHCLFVTDLHGHTARYDKLFAAMVHQRPDAIFVGGDLLPRSSLSAIRSVRGDFVREYLIPGFRKTREAMGMDYPHIFLILGNDDPRCLERDFIVAAEEGIWHYVHGQRLSWQAYTIYGFANVPPTPFQLKDWERYDVSRYVPPGSISPEEGVRSVPVEESHVKWGTIERDLAVLAGGDALERAVFLFHTPPCDTPLDRAALDGKTYEHVPLDVHVGSIAVTRFVHERQPLLTLHGHVHESTRLTGQWKIRTGRTVSINGAHDGPELALVGFDLESPGEAIRELL